MNPHTELVLELTDRIVRLNQNINSLRDDNASLYTQLRDAKKEIERLKVVPIEGPIFKPVFPPSIPFPESKEPAK
jgi:hypothetical protein